MRSYGWQMRFLPSENFSLAHDIDLVAYMKYLEITKVSRHICDSKNALFQLKLISLSI